MVEQQIRINRGEGFGSRRNSGKAWFIISLIIIFLLLAGGGVGYWYLTKNFNKQKADLQRQIDDLNKKLTAAKKAAETTTETTAPAQTTTAFDYSGWNTYTNDKYNYQFKYPDSTTIAEAQKEEFTMTPEEAAAGTTFEQLFNDLTGKICLTITQGEATINISAPENADFGRVICGRTGVGADTDLIPASESIVIDGKTYTASGDTGNLRVELDDGTIIEYSGNLTGADGTIVRHIIESYEPI